MVPFCYFITCTSLFPSRSKGVLAAKKQGLVQASITSVAINIRSLRITKNKITEEPKGPSSVRSTLFKLAQAAFQVCAVTKAANKSRGRCCCHFLEPPRALLPMTLLAGWPHLWCKYAYMRAAVGRDYPPASVCTSCRLITTSLIADGQQSIKERRIKAIEIAQVAGKWVEELGSGGQ